MSLQRKAPGTIRVAACTPRIHLADPRQNCAETLLLMRQGEAEDVDLMLFPELGLTAYSIDDLLHQAVVLDAAEAAIAKLAQATRTMRQTCIVGAPVRHGTRLYNCGVVLSSGRIFGVVPKAFLPNYREFYENRWFSPGAGLADSYVSLNGSAVPIGTDLLFSSDRIEGFTFHVELCEDFWVATPPSSEAALAGATILCNLSASNAVVGKARDREMLCASQSLRCCAAYMYSAAGPGESTTDLAWDGQATIHQLGVQLAASRRFPEKPQQILADVDVELIRRERARHAQMWLAARALSAKSFRRVIFDGAGATAVGA